MRHLAIVGSGPAGYYSAEAAQKRFGDDVRIDIFDRLPVPYGLIRSGVAPDHQSIKAVSRRYEAVSLSDNVRFVGNVTVGRDVTIAELHDAYDAVILATGAPFDRPLALSGSELKGVLGSAAFVGWYNGHPDFADLTPPLDANVVVIGNGNVALDVARILAKTPDEFGGSDIAEHALSALATSQVERIVILGRRGPHQLAMTPKELGELAHLSRAAPSVDPADLPPVAADASLDPGQRKSVAHLREFAASSTEKSIAIDFDFFARPVAIEGEQGRVARIVVERTRIDEKGQALGTGEHYSIPAGLIVACIGYCASPIPDVPYDQAHGRFANVEGRIGSGLYCVGWARRGPSGTIGTNRPDGYAIIDIVAADIAGAPTKAGWDEIAPLLTARAVATVGFDDWQRVEAAEIARARSGAPRGKFTSVDEMLSAARHP